MTISARIIGLLALPFAAVLVLTGCSGTDYGPPSRSADPNKDVGAAKLTFPIDMKPLVAPEEKYFGVALPGVPDAIQPLKTYASKVGKAPNLVKVYLAWDSAFDIKTMKSVWETGAVPWIEWETPQTSMRSIGAGQSDDYLREFALAVKQSNIPVAISYAHEFNGYWYAWGQVNTPGATAKTEKAATFDNVPGDLIRSWRHIVETFRSVDADNVIWTWTPNITNRATVKDVRLQ
ncbi:MAG: glycosyl hydrolase, partial [Streptosporangiaceae bacterium]